MKSSTRDEAEGKLHQVKGKIKEIAGKLTDNPELEAEGKDELLAGKTQEKLGQVKKVVGKKSGVSCAGTPLSPQEGLGGVRKEANMLWTIFVIFLSHSRLVSKPTRAPFR